MGRGKFRIISLAIVEMFGVQDLDLFLRQILGDWQISLKGGVPIRFINRLCGSNATGADKELLETIAAAEFPVGSGGDSDRNVRER